MTEPGYSTAQAQALQENAERLGLVWKKRPATIVSPESDDPTGVTAIMDGDTVAINVYSLIGLVPLGARVMCDIVPPSGIYIVGYIGSPTSLPSGNVKVTRFETLSASTSIVTYAVVAGSSLTFTKRFTQSDLLVHISGAGFASATAFNGFLGVRINGTDYNVTRFFFNTAGEHHSYSGSTLIGAVPSLSAGNVVIELVIRSDVAGKQFNIDANDLIVVTVTEVFL
jgi:hypothetical protein